MRNAPLLMALTLLGCAARRPPAPPFHPAGPVTLAAAPLPEISDDDAFAGAFAEPGRVSLLPLDQTRAKFAADHHLRYLVQEIVDPIYAARRGGTLVDVIGEDELGRLREALAPAELIVIVFKWDVRQRLWHSMTADFSYRVYDLRGGRAVAEDVLSVKTDTNSDLGITEADPQAADKLVGDLGRQIRRQIDALITAPPAPAQ